MTASTRPSKQLGIAIARAYGAAGRDGGTRVPPLGTEHLLLGRLGITPTTVMTVLRRRRDTGAWVHDDAAEPIVDPRLDHLATALNERRDLFGRVRRSTVGMSFTPAARHALHRSLLEAERAGAPQVRPEHLLIALLSDSASRAAETLTVLGVDREVAHRSAVAGTRAGTTEHHPAVEDLDIDLRLTRAVLLGRAQYTPDTAAHRLLLSMFHALHVNWAEAPELWAVLDATEHAQRMGRSTVGTDHLLLAILATHEVAHAHPELLPADAPRRYLGGAVLTELGATHRRIKHTMMSAGSSTTRRAGLDRSDADALRAIGIDVDDILANAERSFGPGALATHTRVRRTRLAPEVRRGWRSGVTAAIGDGGTGEMLATILGREGSAASHMLVAAGIDPHPIRQRLAAAG